VEGGTGDRHCTMAMVCAVVMGGSCSCTRRSVPLCLDTLVSVCGTNPTPACNVFWCIAVSLGFGLCLCQRVHVDRCGYLGTVLLMKGGAHWALGVSGRLQGHCVVQLMSRRAGEGRAGGGFVDERRTRESLGW
jgi:hypothetical protein